MPATCWHEHCTALFPTLARPSCGGRDPIGSFSYTGISGPRGCTGLWVLSSSQHHGQLPCPLSGSLEMAGEPLPSLSPTLRLGSVPAYPGTMPSLWLQKHKIPLIQSLFSTTSQGGRGRCAHGGSLGGLSKPLMIWEVPDAKLRGCLASMCSA